jgi:hypothetical protein
LPWWDSSGCTWNPHESGVLYRFNLARQKEYRDCRLNQNISVQATSLNQHRSPLRRLESCGITEAGYENRDTN